MVVVVVVVVVVMVVVVVVVVMVVVVVIVVVVMVVVVVVVVVAVHPPFFLPFIAAHSLLCFHSLRCHSPHINYVHDMQAVRHIAAGPDYQRRSCEDGDGGGRC